MQLSLSIPTAKEITKKFLLKQLKTIRISVPTGRAPCLNGVKDSPMMQLFRDAGLPVLLTPLEKDRTLRYTPKDEDEYFLPFNKNLSFSQKIIAFQVLIQKYSKLINEKKNIYEIKIKYLSHLENYTKGLFHLFTRWERSANFSKSKWEEGEYLKIRKQLEEIYVYTAHQYLKASQGEKNIEQYKDFEESIQKIVYYLDINQLNIPEEFKMVSYPEQDDPKMTLLNAEHNKKVEPNIDLILALPSGGSMAGVSNQLIQRKNDGSMPELVFLPLSQHDTRASLSTKTTKERLIAMGYTADKLKGKKVLIVDDNTISGGTLATMKNALESFGAIVFCSVVEVDIQAILKRINDALSEKHFLIGDLEALAPCITGIVDPKNEKELQRILNKNLPIEKMLKSLST